MKAFCLFLVVWIIAMLSPVPVRAGGQVVICGGSDEPFGPGPVRVLREAYAALGYVLAVKRFPNARSIVEASEGKCDGELGRIAGITNKYPDLIMVDVPVFWLDIVACTLDKGSAINTWSDLSGKRVSHLSGTIIIEDNLPPDAREVKVQSIETAFEQLRKGRVDVVVATNRRARLVKEQEGLHGFDIHEPPLERINIYHYLHKKDRALAKKLEAVLKKMDEQGRIARILREQ